MFSITTALRKIYRLKKRIRVVQGGTSAGKTIAILAVLINDAQTDTTPTLTSVVSETFPHLKRGAIRDFLNIMRAQGYYDDNAWKRTDYIYTFPNGSQIEFFSADQPDRVKGPRRDRLFLNEANNMRFDTFDQLEVRTKEYIFIDYNPSAEFWYHEQLDGQRDDIDFIIITYKDNEGLDTRIVESIEKRKNKLQWWKVYGLGLLGEVTDRIYTGWIEIDEIPPEAQLLRRGLDFGWSGDPTALVDVYKYNDGFIFDQRLYQLELRDADVAKFLQKEKERVLVIADSASPNRIAEIKLYNIPIVGCVKGHDSKEHGITKVQEQTIYVTKRSVDLIREYRRYLWDVDKNGNRTGETAGADDALDAVRYVIASIVKAVAFIKQATQPTKKLPGQTITGGLLDETF